MVRTWGRMVRTWGRIVRTRGRMIRTWGRMVRTWGRMVRTRGRVLRCPIEVCPLEQSVGRLSYVRRGLGSLFLPFRGPVSLSLSFCYLCFPCFSLPFLVFYLGDCLRGGELCLRFPLPLAVRVRRR